MTDGAILKVIGGRLAQLRLAKNLTQAELAEQAGLGLRTLQRLELGAAATRLTGFVRVCRVLGLVERFEAFLPESATSPIAQLKLLGKPRQRASSGTRLREDAKPWTWGKTS